MKGVLVALDVGTVRVGVAASDPDQVLASPVATVPAADLAAAAAIVRDREAVRVLIGLPRTLAGREGPSVAMATSYAARFAPLVAPVPVELVDERLTTVVAERALADAGIRAKGRRAVVDQAAAVALLQGVLDGAGGPPRRVPGGGGR
ncbi:MAG TPA: Holliday junction resolvase RuvX [Mycobacteriales bacterium]